MTPSLYSCSIDILCLSWTAWELFDLFILGGISLLPANFVGVSGENDSKKSKFWKTLAERALPYVKPRLLSYCAWKSVHGFGLYAWQGKKQSNNNRRHVTLIFHHYGGCHCLYDPNQIWQGCWSAWRYHPCQIWKQTIHNRDFDKRLNFTIIALLGPSPITRLSHSFIDKHDERTIK